MESAENRASDPSRQRIVYIMGRGHSGSTVLDSLLGNGKDIESVGELVSGILRDRGNCSCGEVLKDCQHWTNIKKTFSESGFDWDTDVGALVNQAHLTSFVRTIFAGAKSPWTTNLAQRHSALMNAILSESSDKSILVDSSKEITRAFFLLRAHSDAKVIHLVRNPEGVIASDLHRIVAHGGIKFLRMSIQSKRFPSLALILRSAGWVVGNLLGELAKFMHPSRVMLLRYEELTGNPQATLKQLSDFIESDMDVVIDAVNNKKTMPIGHIVGGNMMRAKGNFVFDPKAGSKRNLSAPYSVLARLICWPLMLRYGYNPLGPLHSSSGSDAVRST